MDASYINDTFAQYKAFSEETGAAVMMQEFGVYHKAPYDLTLQYMDDLLDAANANDLNWCAWDYFGAFGFYAVTKPEMRKYAKYESFSNGWIDRELYGIYQEHLTQ